MVTGFHKFPSTPHLAVLSGVSIRDDKVFTEKERAAFLSNELIVEEKVDGANLGISFDMDGDLLIQNRGEFLIEPLTGQWKKLSDWLKYKIETMFDALSDKLILYGEWCYAKHTIPYDNLPDWFLGFDVFEKSSNIFWSVFKRDGLLGDIGVQPVPFIKKGKFTMFELEKLLTKSRLSTAHAEGLYLRSEVGDRLVARAKLVGPAHISGIEEHWSRTQIEPNRLAARMLY